MKRTIISSLLAALTATGMTLAAVPAGAAARASDGRSPSAGTTTVVAAADAHLTNNQALVHSGGQDSLIRTEVIEGTNGTRYIHYKRTYKGLPVVGGDVVVMTNAAGEVLSTSVAQTENIDIDTTARISAARAKRTSTAQLAEVDRVSQPRLVILTWEDQPQLAWETVVHGSDDEGASKLHVFVDAKSGEVLGSYDEVKAGIGEGYYVGQVSIDTSRRGSSYVMVDPNRPGVRCGGQNGRAYTSPDDRWGNGRGTSLETACVDALYAAQQEWNMLADWLGRNGFDGDGGGFPIRVGLNAVNAYWSGSYVSIGHSRDGQRQLSSMDVVGHELGHAIFQYTPGGAGYGIDNGLNEGTGDIFGALTEFYADNPYDTPDYKVGEEVNLAGNGAIRIMYNPSLRGHPNCYSARVPNMEVHAAAGPLDHWFYLLAEGSNPSDGPSSPTCNGSTVQGVGIRTAGKVFYNALLQKTSTWSYLDVRVDTLEAAKALFPGCTVFNRVKAAWNAVSVPHQRDEPTCTQRSQNDFTVSVSPSSGTLDAGASLTATVSTRVTRGSAQRIELSASGLPADVTASFNPATITSGESAQLSFSAAGEAASGRYEVVITAAGTEVTHTTTFTLTVNGTTPPSICSGESAFTGSLSQGQVAYEPNGSYFYSPAGQHTACLDGPDGADFDLYLQKWNGWFWVDVAGSYTPGPDEELSYTGSAGYYRYQVDAWAGAGSYTLTITTP